MSAAPSAVPSFVPEAGESPTSRKNRSPRGRARQRRLSKPAVRRIAIAATAAVTVGAALSSCSPYNKLWYPLARAGALSQGFHAGHPGIDIATPTGTPVRAASNGVVSFAGWYYGYGNYVCVTRDAGFRTCYGHLSYIYVHRGYKVNGGQTLGMSGSTGNSTGPHLHFEVYRYGRAVNPLPYL